MLGKRKEVVCQAMPSAQPTVDTSSIQSIHDTFFARPEGEAPSNLGSPREYPLYQHVAGKMHMLMPVQVRRRPAVQPNKFEVLSLKYVTKLIPQGWVVKEKRILVGAKEPA
jgi:hypothetical protein